MNVFDLNPSGSGTRWESSHSSRESGGRAGLSDASHAIKRRVWPFSVKPSAGETKGSGKQHFGNDGPSAACGFVS